MKTKSIINADGLRECPAKDKPLENNHVESVLRRLYPHDCNWIHNGNKSLRDSENRTVKTRSGHQVKPDFINEKLKIIIEIDGAGGHNFAHYSSAEQCVKDIEKDELYKELGYKVIRIPMYVQLDSEMIEYYFGIKYEQDLYEACHEHGFLHSDILLPANFCQLGLERFRREYEQLPMNVQNKIAQSLQDRIQMFVDKNNYEYNVAKSIVIPSQLDDIINIK